LPWRDKRHDEFRREKHTPRHFVTAFVFGTKATAVVLSSDVPEAVKRVLNEARAYAEGRGIRLETRTDEDAAVMHKLAAIKMAH
jgi:hypothetical protein